MARRFLGKYDAYKGTWLKNSKQYVLLLLVLFLALRFLIGVSWVSGYSMYPTLDDGTAVVYLRATRHFSHGDIVSLKMAYGEYYIKRVVAVPGDTVEIRDGELLVNGIPDPYSTELTEPQENVVEYPLIVPDGKLFVVGDNRPVSIDSRTFGPVAVSQILGKVFFHIG